MFCCNDIVMQCVKIHSVGKYNTPVIGRGIISGISSVVDCICEPTKPTAMLIFRIVPKLITRTVFCWKPSMGCCVSMGVVVGITCAKNHLCVIVLWKFLFIKILRELFVNWKIKECERRYKGGRDMMYHRTITRSIIDIIPSDAFCFT